MPDSAEDQLIAALTQQAVTPEPEVETPAPETSGPAPWESYLTEVPEVARPLVSDAFKKWDADVTQRFQQRAEEYKWVDPIADLRPLIESDPNFVPSAVNFAMGIRENPEEVLRQFAQSQGYELVKPGTQQAPAAPTQYNPDEIDDPQVRALALQLQQQQDQFRQWQEAQQQTSSAMQEQQAMRELETELTTAFGTHNIREDKLAEAEPFVLTLMQRGLSASDAVKNVAQMIPSLVKPSGIAPVAAPVVMPGVGGGTPSVQRTTINKMNPDELEDLVAAFFKQS